MLVMDVSHSRKHRGNWHTGSKKNHLATNDLFEFLNSERAISSISEEKFIRMIASEARREIN